MEGLADTIRSVLIFSGLSREDVAKVLGKMEEISFETGITIFSQGEQGDAFYLIQSGTVQVLLESGGDKSEVVAILGPRDWFGEMALLTGEPRSATIRTIKPTSLWRLRREDWDELIEKHPTCREAFNSLAEEFYSARDADEQAFFRQASLIGAGDKRTWQEVFQNSQPTHLIVELGDGQFPLIRRLENDKYELHSFFRDFLREKLNAVEGEEMIGRLHARFAERYEALGDLREAIHHRVEAQDWSNAIRLLTAASEPLLNEAPLLLKTILDKFPPEQLFADLRLVNLRASALIQLGDMAGAYRSYREVLTQRASGALA